METSGELVQIPSVPGLISEKQLSQQFGVSTRTLWRWRKPGYLWPKALQNRDRRRACWPITAPTTRRIRNSPPRATASSGDGFRKIAPKLNIASPVGQAAWLFPGSYRSTPKPASKCRSRRTAAELRMRQNLREFLRSLVAKCVQAFFCFCKSDEALHAFKSNRGGRNSCSLSSFRAWNGQLPFRPYRLSTPDR